MTLREITKKMLGLDNPDLIDNSMVCQLWYDGEVTLQKGGGLFGCRNLHMIHPGFAQINLSEDLEKELGRGYVFCEIEEAENITKMLKSLVE